MRRSFASWTVLALAGLATAGCVTVRSAGSHPAPAGTGSGVEVVVYPDDDAREAQTPGPRYVVGQLERREAGGWLPVFRSLDPVWSVTGLPAGRYRVRFPEVLDPSGNVVGVAKAEKELRLADGEVRQLEVTLEHVPTGWIALGIVAGVVADIVLREWLADHGVRPPRLPPEVALVALDIAFPVTVEVPVRGSRCCEARPPLVTSHFPEDGDVVAARRVKVIFAFSEPLGGPFGEEAVAVVGARSGPLVGRLRVDPERWWLVWEPAGDLPRDEEIEVELRGGVVRDHDGNVLQDGVVFRFRTTP